MKFTPLNLALNLNPPSGEGIKSKIMIKIKRVAEIR